MPVQCRSKAGASESNFAGYPKTMEEVHQTGTASKEMQPVVDYLKSDLQHLFKHSFTREHFEDGIVFADPWTSVKTFPLYWFNINFLRWFLAPIYEVHDVRQTGEAEIRARWTFSMQFWWNRYNPTKVLWDPRLVFTGITIFNVNPESGKIAAHIDRWDCLNDNDFFSFQGLRYVLKEMVNPSHGANKETPLFNILKKYWEWEVRRYPSFLAAEVSDEGAGARNGVNSTAGNGHSKHSQLTPAETWTAAYKTLRGYFSGDNNSKKKLEMTVPVYKDSQGVMRWYTGADYQDASSAPQPNDRRIRIAKQPETLCAVHVFAGQPTDDNVLWRVDRLRADLRKDGLEPADGDGSYWVLAEYNWPWTLGPWKRNEILIPVKPESFDLFRDYDF